MDKSPRPKRRPFQSTPDLKFVNRSDPKIIGEERKISREVRIDEEACKNAQARPYYWPPFETAFAPSDDAHPDSRGEPGQNEHAIGPYVNEGQGCEPEVPLFK